MPSPRTRILLDAGVFIGVARGNAATAALVEAGAKRGPLFLAAHTYAEFYRGGARSAREAHLAGVWKPQPLDVTPEAGKLAGMLLAKTQGNNSMDALLVAVAALHGVTHIFTTDIRDITALVGALERSPRGIAVTDAR